MHGTSDHTPEGLRIGEILVGFGYLTRRQLDRHIHGTRDGKGPTTGEALLTSGLITPEELHRSLVHQVQQMFHRLVESKHAIFRFREGFEVAHAHQVRLNINQLLLSSAQAQDETAAPEIRTAAVKQDWDSWTQNLSDKISTVSQWEESEVDPEREDAAMESASAPESHESPEGELENIQAALPSQDSTQEATPEPEEALVHDEPEQAQAQDSQPKKSPKRASKKISNKAKPKVQNPTNQKSRKGHGGKLRSKKRRRG